MIKGPSPAYPSADEPKAEVPLYHGFMRPTGVTTRTAYQGLAENAAVVAAANPKQRFGETKPPLGLMPGTALIEASWALKTGNDKYGPANWRKDPVEAMTYIHAAMRHINQWLDGEHPDPTSGCHHLGHAIANCAILIDAEANGVLIDNRPPPGQVSERIRERTVKDAPSETSEPLREVWAGAGEGLYDPYIRREGYANQSPRFARRQD